MQMLFTRAGYEQSSSEPIARYRAARFGAARRVADLCCGIGGDLLALAAGREALAVDRDEAHARLALHNAGVYGQAANVRAVVADVRDLRLDGLDAVFIDPARRSGPGPPAARPGPAPPPWPDGAAAAARTGAAPPPARRTDSGPACPSRRSTGASRSPNGCPPSASRPPPACRPA